MFSSNNIVVTTRLRIRTSIIAFKLASSRIVIEIGFLTFFSFIAIPFVNSFFVNFFSNISIWIYLGLLLVGFIVLIASDPHGQRIIAGSIYFPIFFVFSAFLVGILFGILSWFVPLDTLVEEDSFVVVWVILFILCWMLSFSMQFIMTELQPYSPEYEPLEAAIYGTLWPLILYIIYYLFTNPLAIVAIILGIIGLEFLYIIFYLPIKEALGTKGNTVNYLITLTFMSLILLGVVDSVFSVFNETPIKISFFLATIIPGTLGLTIAFVVGLVVYVFLAIITLIIAAIIGAIGAAAGESAGQKIYGVVIGLLAMVAGFLLSIGPALEGATDWWHKVISALGRPYNSISLSFRNWYFDLEGIDGYTFFKGSTYQSLVSFSALVLIGFVSIIGLIQGYALGKSGMIESVNDLREALEIIEEESSEILATPNFIENENVSQIRSNLERHGVGNIFGLIIIFDMVSRVLFGLLSILGLIDYRFGLLDLIFIFPDGISDWLFSIGIPRFVEFPLWIIFGLIAVVAGFGSIVRRYTLIIRELRTRSYHKNIITVCSLILLFYLSLFGLAIISSLKGIIAGMIFIEACFFLLGYALSFLVKS